MTHNKTVITSCADPYVTAILFAAFKSTEAQPGCWHISKDTRTPGGPDRANAFSSRNLSA